MKIKTLALLSFFFLVNFYSLQSFSQSLAKADINGRYVIIDDLTMFFIEKDGNLVAENFQLYNILEDESSKPIFVGVSELPNVVKFSIKSGSIVYENQRACKLVIKKDSYINTFNKVLQTMDVKYIISKGEVKTVDEFFNLND